MKRDAAKIKNDILEFLTNNGPSLPISISRHIQIDTLFTSAFLSELFGQQKIKMSNMKVGSSSIYFIPGTQSGLEKYSEYLKSKEKEAYTLLKENSFLEDEKEHPAIRIALREIKDFAILFKNNNKMIWRYFLISESEYKSKIKQEFLEKKPNEEKIKTEDIFKQKIEKNIIKLKQGYEILHENSNDISTINNQKKSNELIRILSEKEKNSPNFTNPLAIKEKTKKTKEKPRSEFCLKTMEFILDNKWKIIKEISHKKNEYNCLIQINSDLGSIIFLTIAKNKKTITETDMTKILGSAQGIPLPALILTTGEIQKKAQSFLEKFNSVLKIKKIN